MVGGRSGGGRRWRPRPSSLQGIPQEVRRLGLAERGQGPPVRPVPSKSTKGGEQVSRSTGLACVRSAARSANRPAQQPVRFSDEGKRKTISVHTKRGADIGLRPPAPSAPTCGREEATFFVFVQDKASPRIGGWVLYVALAYEASVLLQPSVAHS